MNNYRTGPFSSIPMVIKNLLILNIVMFAITWLAEQKFGYNLGMLLGLHYPSSEYFKPFQLVTHMFMHGSFWHLFFNMFTLWMFGMAVETVWGPKRFFIYYMIVGLGAAAFYLGVNAIQFHMIDVAAKDMLATASPDKFMAIIKTHFPQAYDAYLNDNFIKDWYKNPGNIDFAKEAYKQIQMGLTQLMDIPMVGASGAIYGVLLAFGMMFPNQNIYIYFLFPLKAKYMVIIFGLLEVYSGFSQPGSQIAHFAHVGGMIFGFILIKYWRKRPSNLY